MEITTNGRDTHGKFSAGNRFGPGRPAHANKQEYLTALSDELTPEVWRKIVQRAVQDATEGTGRERASAREWFGKYILPQKLDINVTGSLNLTGRNFKDLNSADRAAFMVRAESGEAYLLPDGTIVGEETPETAGFVLAP